MNPLTAWLNTFRPRGGDPLGQVVGWLRQMRSDFRLSRADIVLLCEAKNKGLVPEGMLSARAHGLEGRGYCKTRSRFPQGGAGVILTAQGTKALQRRRRVLDEIGDVE